MFKKDKKTLITGALCLYIIFVFVQSLFFKFTGAPETVYIFQTIDTWVNDTFGISGLFLPPGIFNAYVIGSAELIATILLLTGLFTSRKTLIPLGAILAFGIINGAITFHLFTPLGINVQGDGGTLFYMACGVWLSSAILIVLNKDKLLAIFKR